MVAWEPLSSFFSSLITGKTAIDFIPRSTILPTSSFKISRPNLFIPGIVLIASAPDKSSFMNIGCMRSVFDKFVSASISLSPEFFLILLIRVSGNVLSIFIF